MEVYNLSDTDTRLSRLVERAAHGDSFVIAKAGKPLAKVVVVDAPACGGMRRFGFLAGQVKVPEQFDRVADAEIEGMFEGGT